MVLSDYTRGLTGQIDLTLLKLERSACHLRTSPMQSISLATLYGNTEEVGRVPGGMVTGWRVDPSEYNISLNWNACDWLPCDDDNSVLLMQTSHRVRFDLQKFGYATVKARAQSRTPRPIRGCRSVRQKQTGLCLQTSFNWGNEALGPQSIGALFLEVS